MATYTSTHWRHLRQKLAEVDAQLAAADMDGITLQQFNMIRDQAEMFCKHGI